MHSHAKTSAEIDGNLIYVAASFLFLRKSRGEVLKKNCSSGILPAGLDGLVLWRACGATGRLARLIGSRQARCPPASQRKRPHEFHRAPPGFGVYTCLKVIK